MLVFDPPLEPSNYYESHNVSVHAKIPGTWDPLRENGWDTMGLWNCHPAFGKMATVEFPESIWRPDSRVDVYHVDPMDPIKMVAGSNYQTDFNPSRRTLSIYVDADPFACKGDTFRIQMTKEYNPRS